MAKDDLVHVRIIVQYIWSMEVSSSMKVCANGGRKRASVAHTPPMCRGSFESEYNFNLHGSGRSSVGDKHWAGVVGHNAFLVFFFSFLIAMNLWKKMMCCMHVFFSWQQIDWKALQHFFFTDGLKQILSLKICQIYLWQHKKTCYFVFHHTKKLST